MSPPGRIRTTNLWNYGPALYPIELPGVNITFESDCVSRCFLFAILIYNFYLQSLFTIFIYNFYLQFLLASEDMPQLQLLGNVREHVSYPLTNYVLHSFPTISFREKCLLLSGIRKTLGLLMECSVFPIGPFLFVLLCTPVRFCYLVCMKCRTFSYCPFLNM